MKKGMEQPESKSLGGYDRKPVESYNDRVDKILLDALKSAGAEGVTNADLLAILESDPAGMVDVKVGEEMVPVKYTE